MRAFLPLVSILALAAAPAAGAGEAPPRLVAIPPGAFTMGASPDDPAAAPDEAPAHRVAIARPFLLAETPVTRADFARFVAATGHAPAPGCYTLTEDGWRDDPGASWRDPGFAQAPDHPAVCLSRADGEAYAAWLSAETGLALRLPTEAEWAYAAGEGAAPFWGDAQDICRFGNVNDLTAKNKTAKVAEPCTDGFLHTAPVDTFAAGPHGLLGMIGNVWEWTAGCMAEDGYARTPRDGSAHMETPCAAGVLRGHAWSDAPGPVRLETRLALPPHARSALAGVRLAADARPAHESR